jgi:hypothetical protein
MNSEGNTNNAPAITPWLLFTSALAGLVVHVACLKTTAGFAKPPNPLSHDLRIY